MGWMGILRQLAWGWILKYVLAIFGNPELQGPPPDRRTRIYMKCETRKAHRLGGLCPSVVYRIISWEKGTWSVQNSSMWSKVKTGQKENRALPWETRVGVCRNHLTDRSSQVYYRVMRLSSWFLSQTPTPKVSKVGEGCQVDLVLTWDTVIFPKTGRQVDNQRTLGTVLKVYWEMLQVFSV